MSTASGAWERWKAVGHWKKLGIVYGALMLVFLFIGGWVFMLVGGVGGLFLGGAWAGFHRQRTPKSPDGSCPSCRWRCLASLDLDEPCSCGCKAQHKISAGGK